MLFFCTAFRLSVCLRAAAVTTAELAGAREARKFVFPYAGVLLAGALMLAGNIRALAEYLLRTKEKHLNIALDGENIKIDPIPHA